MIWVLSPFNLPILLHPEILGNRRSLSLKISPDDYCIDCRSKVKKRKEKEVSKVSKKERKIEFNDEQCLREDKDERRDVRITVIESLR